MPSPNQHDHWPVIWISPGHQLPNTCITCGMFTDHHVKATLVQARTEMVTAPAGPGMVALGCLLHFLGPIGWIIGAIMAGRKDDKQVAKTKTDKQKLRVPQCRLCNGMQVVEPIGGNPAGAFQFQAHPRFAERWREVN